MNAYLERTAEILSVQKNSRNGLYTIAVTARKALFGPNKLNDIKKKTMAERIWEQIKNPMIVVLIAAAVLSGIFGRNIDMAAILAVVILNTALGIIMENKAERAIIGLQGLKDLYATVRRNGVEVRIKTEELVPGDIVLLETGDSVPADLRIFESENLTIEEASITGESIPSEKNSLAVSGHRGDAAQGEQSTMAYMGTSVVCGRGEGLVMATGMKTKIGKIAGILANSRTEKTPLQKNLASLGMVLSFAVLGICLFFFIVSILRNGGSFGGHTSEMFLTAVSLAVAAIPEGLVLVVTILLSMGMTRMSGRHTIVRSLSAAETLGCTQVICSDKTGTLTRNKMAVADHTGDTAFLAEAMALSADISAGPDGTLLGEPAELALAEFGISQGLEKQQMEMLEPQVMKLPSDAKRNMVSTIHGMLGTDGISPLFWRQYSRGSPGEIAERCTKIFLDGRIQPMTREVKEKILVDDKYMAGKSLRVFAAAYRDYSRLPADLSAESLERDLTFIGLAGLIDPVRPGVRDAVEKCRAAGIKTIMITGDHEDSAIAIAAELGILSPGQEVITGAELSGLSDKEFEERIQRIAVYVQVESEHKARIIRAWKKLGKITAMTGDGENDVPAMKYADIGIGMGIAGTDGVRSAADMILADDNVASILYAVEEGRRIYENIRKVVQFLLSANLGEVISICAAALAGMQLFAPVHILWLNLITDTFPAMALGMEKADPDSMKKSPRDPGESLFSGGIAFEIIYQGFTIAALTIVSFLTGLKISAITGMTMAFLTLSFCEIFHSISMKSRTASVFSIKNRSKYLFVSMAISTALTVSVIYIPGLSRNFQLTPLSSGSFLIALSLAAAIIPAVEIVKLFKRMNRYSPKRGICKPACNTLRR
ncbi:cation-translocating P-type ATPase [Breznakiella homolactica]|uniref:Cation-translocating P-type ATPase n=1 Tax=Breznakiella homolactica TaxID=2798577 RepID=A0A7T7XLY2_9SPIR|nr:cation-translocating P-type ATPase [Breznakiella homolactica]QQO08693.1 cation-translocating P-type ATPase [Breznakiella homolactica]